jgi:uncharacterized membrane protein
MDFTRAITYVFREPNWIKKILITGLITIIPFLGFIYLIGWIAETVDRYQKNNYPLLPEKPSFSFFINGLKLGIAGIIYWLPLLLIRVLIEIVTRFWVYLFSGFLERAGISLFEFMSSALTFIYFFFFLLLVPCILKIYLERRNIRDTFEFRRIYQALRSNINTYVSLLLSIIICIIIASVGISLFYIGLIFTIPFAAAIYAHLVGQSIRHY